jgi:phosphoribosylanthranilate isomerase
MSLIKVCGLRELPHMLAAAEAGADLLGLVFVPGVRRRIDPQAARALAQAFRQRCPGRPHLVGLFADQPADEVARTAALVGLDRVQLCGHEGPEYWTQMQRPFIQVLHVPDLPPGDSWGQVQTVVALQERLDALAARDALAILDRASEAQPGGLGQPFDWSLARALSGHGYRFLLAGGLTPQNVAGAIAAARPHGVDVSSGVETDGVKDMAKIQAFVHAARRALKALDRDTAPERSPSP